VTTELHTSRVMPSEAAHATAVAEHGHDPFLEGLLKGQQALPAVKLAPLARLRAEAAARLEHLSLPTVRDEDWRFANLKPLREIDFAPATAPAAVSAEQIAPYLLPEAKASRLVFVNGLYAPELSAVAELPAGVVLTSLQAAGPHAELIARHLGRLAPEGAFATLNAALATDGALIVVPRETAFAAPVHLLFVGVAGEQPVAASPRVLVVAEAGASVTVVEDYVTLGDGTVFTNAISELVVAEDAKVNHVRLQRESLSSFHIGRTVAELAHTATYHQDAVTLGGRFTRFEPVILQNAEGIDGSLNGLIFIGNGQFADTHSIIDHAKPMGKSEQVQKCVLDGNARGVFNGKILVRKGAQATNSSQQSRNLLLSDKAKIDTKPQLEIFADDVRCAHGATVGQLDPDEVFYLMSRGLSEREARNLLTYAFAAEVIDRIPLASLRDALRTRVFASTTRETPLGGASRPIDGGLRPVPSAE
jgi:Fe-S cluster assembly protein SufD